MAVGLIADAVQAGARKRSACEIVGVSLRTVERWERDGTGDRRKGSHPDPPNKLTPEEKNRILAVLNDREYRDLSPNQIVPMLADRGVYMASEASMYRLLKENGMNRHRSASHPVVHSRPAELVATGPNEIWSWDITLLPTLYAGVFLYLYMIMDIFSRKIVGWQVHDTELSELAADLVTEACYREKVRPGQVILHSDNGSAMKGQTLLMKLKALGVASSFSRPSVSNDNPYSEALFRTLKYRPEYPEYGFEGLLDARMWVERFVTWYNDVHFHSALRFVTPSMRHEGLDGAVLAGRHRVYEAAKQRHPERWAGATRNWSPIGEVVLNRKHKSRDGTSCYKVTQTETCWPEALN